MTTGPGMHASQADAVPAIREALHAAACAVFPGTAAETLRTHAGEPVDVALGYRWPALAPDLVAITNARSRPADEARVSPQRRQNVDVEVDVTFIAGRYTQTDAEVSARAFALLGALDRHLRGPGITLGGAALWVFCTQIETAGMTTSDDAGEGRIAEIAATFTARVIVTN